MIDIDRLEKALELEVAHPRDWECIRECPYYGRTDCDCFVQVAMDALELIKEYKQLKERHKFLVAKCDDMYSTLKEYSNNNQCENCAMAVEDRPFVVRCKDCKYWEQYSDVPQIGNCPVLDQSKRDNWFCASGEWKEGR